MISKQRECHRRTDHRLPMQHVCDESFADYSDYSEVAKAALTKFQSGISGINFAFDRILGQERFTQLNILT